MVEYEPDTDLRDTEQVPLLEEGGIEAFFRREVLPYAPDAWIDPAKTQIGYEISFTRHFYKPAPLRTLEEIRADIYALEQETEGLLEQIVGEAELMKLAPYPEYKDAGVTWLGSIPSHWSEKRAKYYFKEIDERSQTGDEEMLSVSHITGVTPRSQKNVTMFQAESNVGQKRCQPGDVVINTMWAWMAALGVSNHAGSSARPMGFIAQSTGRSRPLLSRPFASDRRATARSTSAVRPAFARRDCDSTRIGFCRCGSFALRRDEQDTIVTVSESAGPPVPKVHPQQAPPDRAAQGAEAERHQSGRDPRSRSQRQAQAQRRGVDRGYSGALGNYENWTSH